MIKKLLAFTVLSAMLISAIPVYAIPYGEYMSGRQEYMSASYNISPGLTYTETLTKNEKYGYERAYVYEYTPSMGTQIIPSCGDYVYGTESLGTLTKQLESEGKRVVGGINGDFYSTATGVPIGAMIIDGEVISSDNERTAMGFDKDGNAFISRPNIVTKLKSGETEINIEHINKYPLEYCLYLLTDKFYPTTKTTKASSEIVLMPYSESVTYFTEDEMPKEEKTEDEDKTEEKETEERETEQKYVFIYPEQEVASNEETTETETSEITPDESEQTEAISEENTETSESTNETEESEESEEFAETVTDEVSENMEEPTEEPKTDDTYAEDPSEEEIPEETEETEEKAPEYFAKRYTFSDEKIKIGCEIKVVVTEIRRDSKNSNIPEGCFVLCAENELQYDRIKDICIGQELTLSVTSDEEWYEAVNAIGNSGGLILKDGEYCDDVEIDHYPYAHPRTAAGITEDGRVIFYCVDGRQAGSGGLRIDQLSHEMKELGCVIAMNLDGGGSTTAYAALPGDSFSTLKNSPSVTPERRTANSLLFVNTAERLDEIWSYSIFPESPYVLAGGSSYELSAPIPIDKNFYPINLPDGARYEYYTSPITTDSVIVDGNTFVSGEKTGKCDIYLRVWQDIKEDEEAENIPFWEDRSVKDYRVGHIFVLETPEDFTVGEAEYSVTPFETVKLDFSAKYHGLPLYYNSDSLRWLLPKEALPETTGGVEEETKEREELEEPEGTVEIEDAEETYLPIPLDEALQNEKINVSKDLEISFNTHGEALLLKVKAGELVKEIKLNIAEFPFTDSFKHWSAKSLYEINGYGLMKGEPDGDGFAFFPQRNLTKAEFLTVLARMLYPDIDKETEETEEEMSESAEETAEEVTADTTVEASEELEVTEETGEPEPVTELEAEEIEETEEETLEDIFSDSAEIPEWAYKYFDALSESGLLQLVSMTDEEGKTYIGANKNITRTEVLILLGALSDETDVDFVGTFTDTTPLYTSPHFNFINNALAAKIFEGYEDGSLRAEGDLTRAEAATVILRFLQGKASE